MLMGGELVSNVSECTWRVISLGHDNTHTSSLSVSSIAMHHEAPRAEMGLSRTNVKSSHHHPLETKSAVSAYETPSTEPRATQKHPFPFHAITNQRRAH